MSFQAKAIGSGSEGAQTELQKEYHKVSHKILSFPIVINILTNLFLLKNSP